MLRITVVLWEKAVICRRSKLTTEAGLGPAFTFLRSKVVLEWPVRGFLAEEGQACGSLVEPSSRNTDRRNGGRSDVVRLINIANA
jgi:hypothetical protein